MYAFNKLYHSSRSGQFIFLLKERTFVFIKANFLRSWFDLPPARSGPTYFSSTGHSLLKKLTNRKYLVLFIDINRSTSILHKQSRPLITANSSIIRISPPFPTAGSTFLPFNHEFYIPLLCRRIGCCTADLLNRDKRCKRGFTDH